MNDTRLEKNTADVTGRLTGDRNEPIITNQNKLKCPTCNQTFDSRNEYDDHWLACHVDEGLSMASGSMGSMNVNGQSCTETPKKDS